MMRLIGDSNRSNPKKLFEKQLYEEKYSSGKVNKKLRFLFKEFVEQTPRCKTKGNPWSLRSKLLT